MADYSLGTARGRIEIDASGAEAGFAKAATAAEVAEGKANKSTESLLYAGAAVAGVGVAILGGFGLAIKITADFEKRLSGIAAVSGATEAEMEKVREKALQLGADTAFSAGESALAMEELIKAGLSVDDVLNGAADATVNLASAGGVELPKAAEIAANAMNQFGLDAENMPRIADLIAGAANASAISVEDFGMSMAQAGAVANLAGLTFDDAAVAITAMGNAGIKGSDAGTSLKTFLQNLQPTTEKQIELMRELGLVTEDGANQFFDATGKIKPMAEIADELQTALAGMSDAQKTATLETLFGSDAIRAAAVIADEGAAGMNGLADAMGKVTAQDVAEKRLDNLAGSIEQLAGSAETFAIRIGTALQDPLRTLVDGLTGAVNWFNNLSDSTIDMIVKVGLVAGVVLVLVGALLAFLAIQGKITAALAAINALMAANPFVLAAIAIAAVVAALVLAYKRFEAFRNIVDSLWDGVQQLFEPIANAIGGFVDRVVPQLQNLWDMFASGGADAQGFAEILDNIFGNSGDLIPFFEGLYNAVSTAFTWIRDSAVPAAQDFIDRLGGLQNVLKYVGMALALIIAPIPTIAAALVYAYTKFETFRNVVNTVARVVAGALAVAFRWLQSAIETAIPIIQDIGKWILWLGQEVAERAVSYFRWLMDNVAPIWTSIAALIMAVVQRIIGIVQFLWPVFEFFGNQLLNVLVPAVSLAIAGIMNVIRIFVDVAQSLWRNFGDNIMNAIMIAWDFISNTITNALNFIKGIIDLVTGIISGDWGKVWQAIKDIASAVWKQIQNLVRAGVGVVRNLIDSALSFIRTLWDTAWSVITNTIRTIWRTIPDVVSNGITAVVNFFRGLPGRAASALSTLASTLLNIASSAIGSMRGGIERGITTVISIIRGIPGKAVDALGDLGGKLLQAGKDLIQGFIDGIDSMIGRVQDTLGGLTDSLTDWKGPPSVDARILTPNGKLLMEGFIGGIQSMVPALRSALGSLTTALPSMVAVQQQGYAMRPAAEGAGVNVTFDFSGSSFAPGSEEAVRRTVSDPGLISKIVSAAKAGAGAS